MKRLAILALAALMLAGCSATPAAAPATAPPVNDYTAPPQGTPTKTTPAGPTTHKVGEAVKIVQSAGNEAAVTIVSAAYVPVIGEGVTASKPDKGGFLVLDVVWETTAGVTTPNPYYFQVKDAGGHGGDATYGTGDDMRSAPTPVGDKMAGKIAVDVGPGPWRLTVLVGSGPAFWDIPA